MKDALKYAEVHTTQSTHINRKTGARLAEEGGAPASEIARAGGWATGVMETTYLTHFPRQAMRALDGVPVDGGGFHLARAVSVLERLERMVFPDVEKWCVVVLVVNGADIHLREQI